MGFLDQEQRFIQQQFLAEQAKQTERETAKMQRKAELATEAEDRVHAPEDNKVICDLIDNLPAFDIRTYIQTVTRHTGYLGWPFLYTRDEGLQNQELRNKLLKLGLKPMEERWLSLEGEGSGYVNDKLSTVHPSKMFQGYNINPRIGGWFSSKKIAEPQQPGIGFYFWKNIEHTIGRSVTDQVFVRFVLPSHVVITGNGEHINVTSLEVFDNALERGFRYPHRTDVSYPYVQNPP